MRTNPRIAASALLLGRVHPSVSVEVHDFSKDLTARDYFSCALESIAFARKRINNVYFNHRVFLKVRDRSRRADMLARDWVFHLGKQWQRTPADAP